MDTSTKSLKNIFMGIVTTGILTFGGLKSFNAQTTSSMSDPVRELVENMRSATSAEINTEPSLYWKYGEASDALKYSNRHDVIAFVCTLGADAPYADEEIVKAIDENVFTGDSEAPIAIFISPEKAVGKEGAIFTGYIRGESYRDDYTGEKNLSPQELVDTAPQMVNKLNDITRKIDLNPVYSNPENNN